MRLDQMNRRDVVALLAGAAAWPLTARANETTGTIVAGKGLGYDPRITPARRDIAAKHLAGVIPAERYVEGQAYEIGAAQAPLRDAASPGATLLTEALKGERITIYESGTGGWAWGQLAGDGYVGFLPAGALRAPGPAATHKVAALRTFVFPGQSIRLPPLETLSFGCRLAVTRIEQGFAVTAAGYVPTLHLAPAATMETDFVAVAERFLGVPYLWGGKSSVGFDCSGLVQVALAACGIRCPRDTDMQEQALGMAVARTADLELLRRGDLLFWRGHVAIVRDRETVVHANASRHMAVGLEPIASAIPRIRALVGEVTSVRRLTPPA